MKKSICIAAAAIMLVFVATPKQASAQKYQGQVVVGANGAFSLVGAVINFAFNQASGIQGVSSSVTPGLQGTVDYGVTDRFSVGVAYFYQSANAKWSSYTDSVGNTITGDYHLRLTRQNVGLRALFHLGDNDDLDPYFGMRFGYSFWRTETNAPTNGAPSLTKFADKFHPQALFGVRYFFTPNIGVNAEIALGFPYVMSAGINARFGGTK